MNDLVDTIGCFAYVLDHDLILSRPLAEDSVHTLRGAPDGAAILIVVITQSRHPMFCPELRAGN